MSSIFLRCSLGELDVHELTALRLPARGNWVARDIRIAWPAVPAEGSAGELVFLRTDGTEDVFTGTVRTSRRVKDTERVSVTLVGGAGRLLKDIPPRHHGVGAAAVPAGLVLKGIVDDAGERLAAGVEEALEAYPLTQWTRVAGPPKVAIDLLAEELGLGWRMLRDGTIWMGAETWAPVVVPDFVTRVTGEPEDGVVVYEPDAGAPLVGGTTIDGIRAEEVCYSASPGRLVALVREALPGDPRRLPHDPIRQSYLDLYRASWPGTVRGQADDGTLAIEADDPRIGDGLRGIPARVDWPGTKITVPAGTRCRVEFEGASPKGAYARSNDQDPLATKAIALKDDNVAGGSFSALGVAPGAPIQFIYTPPGGVPGAAAPTVTIAGKITGPCHAYAKGKPGS